MAKKTKPDSRETPASGKPSLLVDTRVIYCGDNLDQLKKFPDGCVDLIYIDPPIAKVDFLAKMVYSIVKKPAV